MQNVFLSMTFLLTDLSRCCTRSTYSPWILLTQLDLVPKVLKVLVFMSNNHTYPRGWTPAWEIHWDCLYGKSHLGEGKDKGKIFPSGLPPPSGCKRTTSSQTRWSLPLICHSWDRHFFWWTHPPLTDPGSEKLTSDKAYMSASLMGKSLCWTLLPACLPAYHCFSCHFHPRGLRVIITHAFRRAEHGMMGGLKVWETMKSFFNLRNYRFLKSYGRDWDSLSKMIKMAKISCLFNHLDLQANKLVPRALEGPSRKVCVTYWFLRGHLKRKKIPLEINPFFHIRPSHIFLPLIVPIFNIY